jgi:hypothetical protein
MNKIVIALGAGVLATGVVAGQLWRDLRDVRIQSAHLRDRITVLQAMPAATTPAPAVQTSPPATTVAPGAVPTQTPGSARATAVVRPTSNAPVAADAAQQGDAAKAPAKSEANAMMEGVSRIMGTQAGRDMVTAQLRMMLPRQYPDLGKELGLSNAEEEKFLDMLARQQSELSGDAMGMLGGGQMDRAAAQELQRKIMEKQQANQAEIAATLGDKLPAWQQYQQTLPIRRQVNELQTALGGSNALTDSQTKSVIAAMAAEQTRINEERRNAPPLPRAGTGNNTAEAQLQREAQSNARMVEAASPHLNSQQMDSFRKVLEQQMEMARTLVRSLNLPQQ